MALHFGDRQKQIAAAFWKSYFAKFQRPITDHEVSETAPAPLSGEAPLQLVERRRPGTRRTNFPAR
jgi:hypothetical protein